MRPPFPCAKHPKGCKRLRVGLCVLHASLVCLSLACTRFDHFCGGSEQSFHPILHSRSPCLACFSLVSFSFVSHCLRFIHHCAGFVIVALAVRVWFVFPTAFWVIAGRLAKLARAVRVWPVATPTKRTCELCKSHGLPLSSALAITESACCKSSSLAIGCVRFRSASNNSGAAAISRAFASASV